MKSSEIDVTAPCWSLPLTKVLSVVEEECGVGLREIVSPARRKDLVKARHIYAHAAKAATRRSLLAISLQINRDHSTVLHGLKKVRAYRKQFEPELSRVMARLEKSMWIRLQRPLAKQQPQSM